MLRSHIGDVSREIRKIEGERERPTEINRDHDHCSSKNIHTFQTGMECFFSAQPWVKYCFRSKITNLSQILSSTIVHNFRIMLMVILLDAKIMSIQYLFHRISFCYPNIS